MNYILGIYDGHNATAALLRNGIVEAAVSEGRIVRQKQVAGYPRNAIEEVLEIAGISPGDIDRVALSSQFMHPAEFYQSHDWYKKNYRDQLKEAKKEPERREYYLEERQRQRKQTIIDHLGVSESQIEIVEHHTGHAASAYYASPWASTDEEVLVLTLDGSGDGICATVNIGENGALWRVTKTPSAASIGKVYSRVTYLLGMRPWQDEFKLMGMAPYADEEFVDWVYEVFEPLVDLPEGSVHFRPGTHLHTNYCYSYLKSNLENYRFDWICGALQKWLEDLVVRWVRNAIDQHGIRRVALAGGVFMNVKANMKILQMDEVTDLFVHPSCGDSSLAIGAVYKVHADQRGWAGRKDGIDQIYWGPEYSNEEMQEAIEESGLSYSAPGDIYFEMGKLLRRGEIVANFNGRMEWGARALGNRSILADPRSQDNVRKLNKMIKERDFWMPFAPSLLDTWADRYIEDYDWCDAPYMIRAFPTTDLGREELSAAMHPYDGTIRPQIVTEEANKDYYEILRSFRRMAGVGGVLNTSFNLHGEPIVMTPEDAIRTLESSGLEYLRMGPYIVEDKQ